MALFLNNFYKVANFNVLNKLSGRIRYLRGPDPAAGRELNMADLVYICVAIIVHRWQAILVGFGLDPAQGCRLNFFIGCANVKDSNSIH